MGAACASGQRQESGVNLWREPKLLEPDGKDGGPFWIASLPSTFERGDVDLACRFRAHDCRNIYSWVSYGGVNLGSSSEVDALRWHM